MIIICLIHSHCCISSSHSPSVKSVADNGEKASWNELKEKTMSMDSWKKQISEKRAGEQSPCKKKTEKELER